MRTLIVFACFTLAGVGLSAFGDQHRKAITHAEAGFQSGLYYFGGTYRRLLADTPESCAALCSADARCLAWSQLPQGPESAAVCELKRNGGLPEARPLAVSGRSPRHEAVFADPYLRSLPPGASAALGNTELAGGPR